MRKTIFTILLCFIMSFSAFGQENYAKLVDSLRYVTEVPYLFNCSDPVFWKIVCKGKSILPVYQVNLPFCQNNLNVVRHTVIFTSGTKK